MCTVTFPLSKRTLIISRVKKFFLIGGVNGITLEDVMVFATGCDHTPISGFEKQPSSTILLLTTASTSGRILCLPAQVEGAAGFSEQMRVALLESFGFGQV